MRWLSALVVSFSLAWSADDKLRLVRESDALKPEQELAALHAPPGFTVQLFASEPMINKPVNMAFDARGRLWVSSTVEYPYAAARDRWADAQGSRVKDSRDAIKILEDTDGDGKADKVIDFADGLNIPTGVLPWHKPEHKDGCIAWSIPNIWYFADTDGDGKCDKREVLFGPLGYEKDTHGMCSSFRLGLDGWVYATHGFNNTSHLRVLPQHQATVRNPQSEMLDLHSGNVFRFRPDGSAVELYSAGQVNPFGLCWDRYGNLYSADCHSNPITQLIRGACYPSFGKPHDGLGFGPVMCEHSHGSTGLCGIIYIDGGIWGPEWDDHMFLGNCVTSKVNHDKITFTGSTPKANEQPDFITSDDLWFRPVDLQLGPDNALYIADFYNKIIGHYEVPLDHPGRDKERGRIWRVVNGSTTKPAALDFSVNETERAIDIIGSGQPVQTRLAVQKLQQQIKTGFFSRPMTPEMDVLFNWGELRTNYGWQHAFRFPGSIAADGDAFVAVQQLAQAETINDVDASWYSFVRSGLNHPSPVVRCAAARALKAHPNPESVTALLKCWDTTPDGDLHLRHQLRLTLREHFMDVFGLMQAIKLGHRELAGEIAMAVPTSDAASFLLNEWRSEAVSGDQVLAIIVRHGSPNAIDQLITEARKRSPARTEAIAAIHNGLLERGTQPPPALLTWATDLAESLLAAQQTHRSDWSPLPHPSHPADEPPWCLQDRKCADGQMAKVISSLDKDKKAPEKLTGILRSKTFAAPAKLSFWICGHQGFPSTEANQKNLVRLVAAEASQSGPLSPLSGSQAEELRSAQRTVRTTFPPRSDVCQRIEWDLADLKGRQVALEVVDGDDGPSYAWLGITRIEPEVVSIDTFTTDNEKQKQLRTLGAILKTTAPVGLRDKLAPYLPKPAVAPAPPKPRPELDSLIASRRASFAKAKPEVATGEAIFKANCAVCHSIKGQGGVIGPQLDGVGNRGADRLIEDVLDPNRNVDAHFHLHQLKLRDGSTATGFVRGEVGQVTILVDAANNEQRISKGDIVEDNDLPQSLMPPTFGQTIPEKDFADLIGWLGAQK